MASRERWITPNNTVVICLVLGEADENGEDDAWEAAVLFRPLTSINTKRLGYF